MMYEGFANVYDHMMNHIPYETWFENLLQYLHEKGVLNGRICELGCGTGVMTEKFAAAGYDMIGLDKSVDMLAIAKQKQEAVPIFCICIRTWKKWNWTAR